LPTTAGTVDAQDNYEVWKFSLQASNQNLRVTRLAFTNIGSTSASDIVNFKLYDGGVQIGSAVASADANKRIEFDLSSTPLDITSGVTKQLTLKADIKAGSARTFQFSIQKPSDIYVWDRQYNVALFPFPSGGTVGVWTVVQAGGATTINPGTLSVSRTSTSRSGNAAINGTNQELATFEFKAAGEDVKVNTLNVRAQVGAVGSGKTIKNVKLLATEAQVGTIQTTVTSTAVAAINAGTSGAVVTDANDVSFTLGNSLVVKAGTSTFVKVVADLTGTGVAADAVQVALVAQSGNAQGTASLTGIAAPAATTTGNSLILASGSLTGAKSAAVADMTVVKGANNQLVGQVVLTAGSAEGLDLNSLTITDADGTNGLGAALSNVKLMTTINGVSTQLGSTQVNPSSTTAATLTFSISPAVSIAASGSVTLDFRADILSGATLTGNNDSIKVTAATGVGKSTTTTISLASSATLQVYTVVAGGTVSVSVDSSTPQDQIVVMNTTQNTLGAFRVSANNAEDLIVNQLIFVDNSTDANSVSNVTNLKLYADGVPVGNTVATLSKIRNNTLSANVGGSTTAPTVTDGTTFTSTDVGYYIVMTSGTNAGKIGRVVSVAANVATLAAVGGVWTTGTDNGASYKEVSGAVFSNISKPVSMNGFKVFTLKADVPTNSNAYVALKSRFVLGTLVASPTGAGTDTFIATGASSGAYATLSSLNTTYALNNSLAHRTSLRATLNSASPSGTGKVRQSNDIPFKFDLAANAANRALFRGGLQDSVESLTPSSGTLAGAWTVTGTTPTRALETTVKVEGSNSLKFTEDGSAALSDGVKNTLTTATDLSGYTGVGFWMRSDTTSAAADIAFSVYETADVFGTPVAGNTCTTGVLTANKWKYVTCVFAGADANIRNAVDRYGFHIAANAATYNAANIYIDDIRFSKDMMRVNVAGSSLLADTATPILMTLKNANTGATVATGYFVTSTTSTTNGIATFIPVANTTSGTVTGDFEIAGGSTTTVNLVVDSSALFTAAGSLSMNMNLGSSSSTVSASGDISWYDEFVNVTTGLPQVGIYGTSAANTTLVTPFIGTGVGTIPWISAGSDANPLQGGSLSYN
ncbi:MAG: hypothetical protein AAB870_04540, partial [Patescibacteria group bacterium]